MNTFPFNQEYRAAFEKVVGLLKVAQERTLSATESKQLDVHIAICRHYEK
ncbi:hypothetical protein [Vibrio parahaemolyticus]|nr:hypothetical protein [Vibrio parahaemolyticus]